MTEPEDVLVFADPSLEPIAVSASRMRADGAGRFVLEEDLPDRSDLHGATVVARSDGAVVALVQTQEEAKTLFLPLAE